MLSYYNYDPELVMGDSPCASPSLDCRSTPRHSSREGREKEEEAKQKQSQTQSRLLILQREKQQHKHQQFSSRVRLTSPSPTSARREHSHSPHGLLRNRSPMAYLAETDTSCRRKHAVSEEETHHFFYCGCPHPTPSTEGGGGAVQRESSDKKKKVATDGGETNPQPLPTEKEKDQVPAIARDPVIVPPQFTFSPSINATFAEEAQPREEENPSSSSSPPPPAASHSLPPWQRLHLLALEQREKLEKKRRLALEQRRIEEDRIVAAAAAAAGASFSASTMERLAHSKAPRSLAYKKVDGKLVKRLGYDSPTPPKHKQDSTNSPPAVVHCSPRLNELAYERIPFMMKKSGEEAVMWEEGQERQAIFEEQIFARRVLSYRCLESLKRCTIEEQFSKKVSVFWQLLLDFAELYKNESQARKEIKRECDEELSSLHSTAFEVAGASPLTVPHVERETFQVFPMANDLFVDVFTEREWIGTFCCNEAVSVVNHRDSSNFFIEAFIIPPEEHVSGTDLQQGAYSTHGGEHQGAFALDRQVFFTQRLVRNSDGKIEPDFVDTGANVFSLKFRRRGAIFSSADIEARLYSNGSSSSNSEEEGRPFNKILTPDARRVTLPPNCRLAGIALNQSREVPFSICNGERPPIDEPSEAYPGPFSLTFSHNCPIVDTTLFTTGKDMKKLLVVAHCSISSSWRHLREGVKALQKECKRKEISVAFAVCGGGSECGVVEMFDGDFNTDFVKWIFSFHPDGGNQGNLLVALSGPLEETERVTDVVALVNGGIAPFSLDPQLREYWGTFCWKYVGIRFHFIAVGMEADSESFMRMARIGCGKFEQWI